MANFASYGNCMDLMEYIGSKIPKKIEIPRSDNGTLRKFIMDNILDLPMKIYVPTMSFIISGGERLHINCSVPQYTGIEKFHKIGSGSESSFQIDGKYVGLEIFNNNETTIGDCPRIQLYGVLMDISKSQNGATVYINILNKPKADLIIPTINQVGYTKSGLKLLVTDGINDLTSEYTYTTNSESLPKIENSKVFDVTDYMSYVMDPSSGSGNFLTQYYPILYFNTTGQTFNASAMFGGAGGGRKYTGRLVQDVVRKYCAIKGIDIPYISSVNSDGVDEYGSELYTPNDIRLYTNSDNIIWRL